MKTLSQLNRYSILHNVAIIINRKPKNKGNINIDFGKKYSRIGELDV